MTDTKSPAELLGLYDRLCFAVGSDEHPGIGITPSGFCYVVTVSSGGGVGVSDDIATDILEARIWRVLREWDPQHEWSEGWITIFNPQGFAVCRAATLAEAAEAVIEHIRQHAGETGGADA